MKLFIAICLIVIPLLIIMNEKPRIIKELNEFGYLTMKQFENRFEYLGGFRDVSAPKKFDLIFKENEMIFNFINTSTSKIIQRGDINDIEIMTQSQIKNEISLGKLLVFGILAFGMKKEEEEIKNYVVLKYKDNDKHRSVIISTCCPEAIIKYIDNWSVRPLECRGKEVYQL